MKNLIEAFSFLTFRKEVDKNLNKKSEFIKGNSVHRRRDLDSLEEFINF